MHRRSQKETTAGKRRPLALGYSLGSVAEADAQSPGCPHHISLDWDALDLGEGFTERHRFHVGRVQGDHGSKIAPLHQPYGCGPDSKSQESVIRVGLPSTLEVAQDEGSCLHLTVFLDLLRNLLR